MYIIAPYTSVFKDCIIVTDELILKIGVPLGNRGDFGPLVKNDLFWQENTEIIIEL